MNSARHKGAAAVVIFIIFSSCSLNYDKSAAHFEKRPNMVFKNITLDRYEEKKLTMKIDSERLEMYDSEKIWAGKNLRFIQLEKNNKNKNEFSGFAGAVLIDNGKDEYFLGKTVEFKYEKDGIIISSPALYWLKKENMLFAPESQPVSIQKNNEVSLTGYGFVANTSAKSFELNSAVNGLIETDKNSGDEASASAGFKSESVFSSGLENSLSGLTGTGVKSE